MTFKSKQVKRSEEMHWTSEESNHFPVCVEDLNNNSQQFAYGANRVRQKFWWQNVKVSAD